MILPGLNEVSKTTLILTLCVTIATGVLLLTFSQTSDRIAANERTYLLKQLHEVIPVQIHDNDLYTDTFTFHDPGVFGVDFPITVYRARRNGQPVALAITAVAPDGYSSRIKLMVGVKIDGTITQVRVLDHKETPGLGDGIEIRRSPWISQFQQKNLKNPPKNDWKVTKDGGKFDQMTSATITSRAVVKAVYKTVDYVLKHHQTLFQNSKDLPNAAMVKNP